MREGPSLEFKEAVTNTFLKTVSAYANYGSGKILFGIKDDGTIVGVKNPWAQCLDIENRINDSIEPVPQYTLSINERTSVITLTVEEGLHKPYLYKAKAYRRNDTATIQADRLELTRLILQGQSSSFEELPARTGSLTFHTLEEKLKQSLNLQAVTRDTLKTLELFTDGEGANIAAELLADVNSFCGTDIVRFGDSISILLDRETHERESVLKQYDAAMDMYRKYYQYDEIKGSVRQTISLIPEDAFREAVANALVHRAWDVNADINIAMHPDRVVITSPGGLPPGMTREEYLRGGVSVLRNRILGTVFFRLKLIERFGTDIRRINEAYTASETKPQFTVGENSVQMTLPITRLSGSLTTDESTIFQLLKGRAMPSSAIVEATGFGKSKVVKMLKSLTESGYIRVIGSGRGTKYTSS